MSKSMFKDIDASLSSQLGYNLQTSWDVTISRTWSLWHIPQRVGVIHRNNSAQREKFPWRQLRSRRSRREIDNGCYQHLYQNNDE